LVINYVKRTREQLILDEAASEAAFSADDTIPRQSPKSVLCVPIVRRSSLVGILYLENSLTSIAFTAQRLALLDFITAQAAIALENAAL
jgi:GAF domain-containing protein